MSARFEEYTVNLVAEGWIDEPMRNYGVALDALMYLAHPEIGRPDVSAGESGRLFFEWHDDLAGLYLEAEIRQDGTVEWFYKDRPLGDIQGEDIPLDEWSLGCGKTCPDWPQVYERLGAARKEQGESGGP